VARIGPAEAEAVVRIERLLLGGAEAALGVALVALGWQYLAGYGVLAPVAVYQLLLASVLYVSHVSARSADRPGVPPSRSAEEEAVRGETAEPQASGTDAERPRALRGRHPDAFVLSVAGAAGLGLIVASLWGNLASGPVGRITLLLALSLGILAFLLLVAVRAVVASATSLPDSVALGEWLRGGQWVATLTGAGLLARALGLTAVYLGWWIAVILLAGCAVCAGELWVRSAVGAVRPRDPRPSVAPPRLVALQVLLCGGVSLHGLAELAEQRLGLSLRSTWAITFVRRSAGVLLVSLVGLVWLSTTLAVVGPQEQGIRLRFGGLVSRMPVGPGLHLKWPWPLETVDRYPVTRVQTLALGYAGPPKESLLWARTHAGEEYQLLLGDGRELLSVDATVSYRIRDVVAFAFGSQNTRETLEALAYRLLMRETVASNLDRVLTADRTEFGRRFTGALQRACDEQGLGLDVLHVGFISLHPPVGIATAYEDVVSAEIERETRAARARTYQEATVPAAQTEATRQVQEAEAEGARRLAEAKGAAVRFLATLGASRTGPELFRFRRRLEALEYGLAGRSLFIVDHRLRTGAGELWIDVRPTTPKPRQRGNP
jgi:regulator of protease activity HflC (stomatin/prohibitin superfamily)